MPTRVTSGWTTDFADRSHSDNNRNATSITCSMRSLSVCQLYGMVMLSSPPYFPDKYVYAYYNKSWIRQQNL